MRAIYILVLGLTASALHGAETASAVVEKVPHAPVQNSRRRAPVGESEGRFDATPSTPTVPSEIESVKLPPLPDGVGDLKFREMFRSPVGDRGLEFSDKARSLDGKKVRLLGYMVRQSTPTPWKILFSPVPMTVCEREYGFCDDLPASVVHVTLPKGPSPLAPFTPGPMLLTGTLHLGNHDEADGRISFVRLDLDRPATTASAPVSGHASVMPEATVVSPHR